MDRKPYSPRTESSSPQTLHPQQFGLQGDGPRLVEDVCRGAQASDGLAEEGTGGEAGLKAAR